MRTCIVLGAGATLANALRFRSKRRRATLPPLDYTFFEKIAELDIAVPRDLRAYAARLPTGSPFDKVRSTSRMEEFMRDLFHDFLQQRTTASSEPVLAYRQMVRIYARVLGDTTNWMLDPRRTSGPLGQLIAATAEHADQLDIITFNHDLVIENEIFKRARLRQRWCLERSYGDFSAGKSYVEMPTVPHFPWCGNGCDHSRPIVVHKMHGSLNWYIRIRGREPTPGVLDGSVSGHDVMISIDRTVGRMQRVRMTGTGPGRRRWYVWPVIVPPVYAKQTLIASFMPSVWREAREALLSSDRILFCGYSLPMADIEAEKIVQRSIASNTSARWIDIIDPQPTSVTRYGSLLPNLPIRWFPSIDAFLRVSGGAT